MGEPVDGECIADAAGAGYVAFVASVVFLGRADVPSVDSVWCHVGSLVWTDVYYDSGAWRCKGRLVEVEVAVEACICRELGLSPRGAKEVEGYFGLWHEQIPFGEWKFGIAGR
jgi:hypothetical protein